MSLSMSMTTSLYMSCSCPCAWTSQCQWQYPRLYQRSYPCWMSMSNAACPYSYCKSMSILQIHVHAACPIVHATVPVGAACSHWCCTFMLHFSVYVACPCLHATCPCCISMLHIRAARPCCIFVLHVMLHARSRNCEVKNKSKTITVQQNYWHYLEVLKHSPISGETAL